MTTVPERWAKVMIPTYGTPQLALAHGEGCRVWDVNGKPYLDFLAGLAVSSTGHGHPRVVEAIRTQAGRLLHTSNLYATEENVRLAERLTTLTGYPRAFFCNSGAETNEFAIKLVRRAANRRGIKDGVILAATGSFHGRTLATVTLTGQPKYQKDFDPLPAGFAHVPFNDVGALEDAFESDRVVGLFLEMVQGEGGVVPADAAYARAARRLCDATGALLVADEVQTGVGRTGRFLAQERYGIRADVTTLAKGLASGVPIGAVLATESVSQLVGPGDHGCTFGGNPLSSAAALATLDVVERERLVERAETMGGLLRVRLAERVPDLAEVRGLGLLNAIVFDEPIAKAVRDAAQERGLLTGLIGDRILRLAPPLIVGEREIEEAVDILEKSVLR